VLKRTDRNSAEGVVVVESLADLRAQRASPLFAGHEVLLQEFIDDDTDYVTHLVAVDGAIVWQVTYAFGLADGRTMRGPRNYRSVGASEISPTEIALFEQFLRPLAFSGPANVDFRRRPDGSVVILEINPRFGLSLLRPEHVADLRAAVGAILAHATLHR
jgi:carbamoylphosphate synthase large subunit